MPDGVQVTPTPEGAGHIAEQQNAGVPAVPAGAVTPTADGGAVQALPNGKVQVLSPSAYKRIRDESKERGKKEMLAELNSRALQLGFKSHDDLIIQAAASRVNGNGNAGGQRQAAQPVPAGNVDPALAPRPPAAGKKDHKAWAHYERQVEQNKKKAEEAELRAKDENRRRRKLQAQKDALETEIELQRTIMQGGGKDVKYLTHLLREDLQGKSEEELQKFDESLWLKKKREEAPYLFGEITVPATTGTGGSGAPPSPQPGAAAAKAANGSKVNVRDMKPEEYRAHLAKMGLHL